jgi:putative ABC transport system substrate-binding protein
MVRSIRSHLFGLIDSLSHPGGNITGMSGFYAQLNPKRLELVKEIVPNVSRVAILPNTIAQFPGRGALELKQIARDMKIDLQILEVQSAADFPTAFTTASKAHVGAIMLLPDPTGIYFANIIRSSVSRHNTAFQSLEQPVLTQALAH